MAKQDDLSTNLYRLIKRRRMVRNLTSQPIGEETLMRILDAAVRAPSAGFSQGISFIAVSNPELRAALGRLAGESRFRHPFISRAAVVVVLCTSEAVYRNRYAEADKLLEDGRRIDPPVPWWYFDAGCSLMLMLLAATYEGLDAAFVAIPAHSQGDLRTALAIPAEVSPVGLVALGRRPKGAKLPRPARSRRSLEDIVHTDRWSG